MRLIPVIVCLLFAPALGAKCLGDYVAPDKSATVKIRALNKAHESLLQFFDARGTLLHQEDYSSPDMEHGSVVSTCAWTADSAFFVYSSYSSGGHQAWHFPTLFYSPVRNHLYSLDSLVGPITDGDFSLKSGDTIETAGRLAGKTAIHVVRKINPNEPDVVFDVSLSHLLNDERP